MQQLTQDRARPRTVRALARIAATLLLAAAVSQPELAHAAPYGGGSHAGGFGGFHGGGFSGLHHSVNPSHLTHRRGVCEGQACIDGCWASRTPGAECPKNYARM
jgi:hypothetical protein